MERTTCKEPSVGKEVTNNDSATAAGPVEKLQKTAHSIAASKEICRAIKQSDADWRARYPILNNQDAIGFGIWSGSLLLMLVIARLYLKHVISPITAIILMAIPLSLLHELEHDLIHNLYFKSNPRLQDLMFLVIWLCKLHGSPWMRRELHLKHHLLSGQMDDAEERLIGLGLPYGFKRLAVTVHPAGGTLVAHDISRDATWLDVVRLRRSSAPVIGIFLVFTKAFLVYTLCMWIFGGIPFFLPASLWPSTRDFTILLCFPNLLRQASLVLMSNCSHYFGDIPEKDAFFQNQILDSWLVFPFQLFCFNFGSTHIVHHYVPGQPFYLRQLTAIDIKEKMVELGVRHNDIGIVYRANRYQQPSDPAQITREYYLGLAWFFAAATLGFASFVIADFMVTYTTSQTIAKLINDHRNKKARIAALPSPTDSKDVTAPAASVTPSDNPAAPTLRKRFHVPSTAEMQALADSMLYGDSSDPTMDCINPNVAENADAADKIIPAN